MSNLDIIADILSRLPVKTLLRFRCVSKSWCVVIDSTYFIKIHLNCSVQNNSYISRLLDDAKLYSINLDLLSKKAIKLDRRLKKSCNTGAWCSCNGLFLLGDENRVSIWNPSTRKSHNLPYLPIQPPNYVNHSRVVRFGFGYDSVAEDYIVVRIVSFNYFCEKYDSLSSAVQLYSLKSYTWRRVKDMPRDLHLGLGWNSVFAGGALHWLVRRENDLSRANLILAFDIGVEEYQLVPQPECFHLDGSFRMVLEVLGGCLCVTCLYESYLINQCRYDIWVMKDYGVKESWTKLFSIEPPSTRYFGYVKPLAYSKSAGEILVDYEDKGLIWFELTGKLVKKASNRAMPFSFNGDVCVESLVPLDGYGQIDGGKNHMDKPKSKEKKDRNERNEILSDGFKHRN